MKPRRPILRTFAAALIAGAFTCAALAPASPAFACPNCKESLPDGTREDGSGQPGDGGANVAGGFAWSVVFMMAMPFTLVAAAGGAVWYFHRRARHLGDLNDAA